MSKFTIKINFHLSYKVELKNTTDPQEIAIKIAPKSIMQFSPTFLCLSNTTPSPLQQIAFLLFKAFKKVACHSRSSNSLIYAIFD